MAKYVQPNFIIESSANFTKNVSFQDVVHFKEATNVDASLYVKGIPVGSMIYESSLNYYDASTVDILIDAIDVSTTLKFVEVDSSISRIDASLNDVIDISDVIDASLAEKVDKAGDTMTGELVLDAGFQLDGISITTIDTSAEGLSQLDTAIPTSGAVKALVNSAISDGVTASNGLTKSVDGSIGLGGTLNTNTSIDGDNYTKNFSFDNINRFGAYAKTNAHVGVTDSDTLEQAYVDFTNSSINFLIRDINDSVTQISFNDSALQILDDINSQGLVYGNDYSSNYTDRSLPDWATVKGYVDGSISSNEFVLTSGEGTTANGTAVDLGGALSSDANIITGTNKLFVTGEMNIVGNLIVDGSTTTVDSVNLDVSDNIITINSGETGTGVSKGYAGLLVDRGLVDPYVFVFEESSDTFRIGIGTEAGLPTGTQSVATREDAPTANGIGFWNNTENRIDTSSGLVFTYGVGVEYEEELHSSYTDRTLVDKEYVDNKAGTIDAWNGLSNTDGSIGLGGEITQDIALTFGVGSAHKFNIGQQFAPAAEVSVVTNDSINFAGASSDFTKIGAVSVNVSGSETRISLDAANGISQASSLFDVTTSGLTLSNTINDGELVTTELNIIESGINVSSQDSSFGGIKYTQDISTNFTDRSLVDKAYVDTKVGTIDAWNGLSNTDGSIGLGGTLTSNTEVTNDYNGSTFATRIGDTDAENYNNYTPTQTYLTLSDSITYDQAYIDLNLNSNAPKIDIFTSNAGGDKVGLYIDGSLGEESLTIKDDVNSKGIVYATDYSTNFTDRSLVDKGYVDGQVSQAVSTGAFKYSGTFDGTADVSALITAATHTLGTGPFMISVYEDDIQVVPDISFNTSGDVKIEWGIGTLNTNCSYIIIG